MNMKVNMIAAYLKKLIGYLCIVFLVIVLYTELSRYWSAIGGIRGGIIRFEVPFILGVVSILFFSWIKNKYIVYVLPTLPVFVVYFSFDMFYGFLGRSPRPSDFHNIHLISDFSIGLAFLVFVLISFIILPIALLLYIAHKEKSFGQMVFALFWRAVALSLVVFVLLSDRFVADYLKYYNYTGWSQEKSIKENGRISSFLFYGYQERKNYSLLQDFFGKKINTNEILYPGNIKKPRNIHIVVLESFIDPRQLKGVTFNRSPLADALLPYLIQGKFSHVISPVYGGNTAEAEFEILTGVKGLAKIESTEFNIMKGGEIKGFSGLLKDYGYKNVATIATKSGYYNSVFAYQSLGFDNVLFLGDNNVFKNKEISNSDKGLLDYSLSRIEEALKNGDYPLVSYTLGMYGHFPYERNMLEEPDLIDVSHADDRVKRVANQFYYRTQAIAGFLQRLIAIDPTSIIYITSDHIPPLLDNNINYSLDRYVNISLFVEDGKTVDVSGKKYFEIPWLIWDSLTETENDRLLDDREMEEVYFKFLSESQKTEN